MRLKFVLPLLLALIACDARGRFPIGSAGDACEPPTIVGALPDNLREASGIVISRRHENLLWSHNDGGSSTLHAIDTTGKARGHVRVDADIVDWEDLAAADCADGTCLYLADIGNNLRERKQGAIHRIAEPDPGDSITSPAKTFRFRYPDGDHDAEALFVLPGERVYIITKGRSGPITVYRYPGPLRDEVVTLESVQTLSPGIVQVPDMVTGAAATPDGSTIAVRTYGWLQLYRLAGDTLQPVRSAPVDLTAIAEPQGEAIDIRADGTIFLASEQGLARTSPPLSRLRCSI